MENLLIHRSELLTDWRNQFQLSIFKIYQCVFSWQFHRVDVIWCSTSSTLINRPNNTYGPTKTHWPKTKPALYDTHPITCFKCLRTHTNTPLLMLVCI